MHQGTSAIVRRMLAADLRLDESILNDDFRWIEETTEEDAGWFLAALQDKFGVTLFGSDISPTELEKIATVGGLVTHVEQQLARKRR